MMILKSFFSPINSFTQTNRLLHVFSSVSGNKLLFSLLLIFIGFLFVGAVNAQPPVFVRNYTVGGTVTKNGQPAPGKSVIIRSTYDNPGTPGPHYARIQQVATSDDNGHFSVSVPCFERSSGDLGFSMEHVGKVTGSTTSWGGPTFGSCIHAADTFINSIIVSADTSTEGDDQNGGPTCPVIALPVNVTNGNMWLQHSDYYLPGIGESINITRTYNSLTTSNGVFGLGWYTAYDETILNYNNEYLRFDDGTGHGVYLVNFGNDTYFPATRDFYGQIVRNSDNTYNLTFQDGRVHKFSATGKLLWQRDRNKNQTTISYDTNGRISSVADASGRTLTFTTYANGTVQYINDSLGTIATYEYYTNTKLLKTVTYNDESKYKFEYVDKTIDGQTRTFLATVRDARDNILETHDYDNQGRATTSGKGVNGAIEKYTFDYSNWGATNPYTRVTYQKENDGTPTTIESKYFFDKSKGHNVVTKSEGGCNCAGGSEVMTFEYDDKLNLKKKVDALNRETTYVYDDKGNPSTITDVWGTRTLTYNSFGQILTYKDRMNGLTTFNYDINGNPLTIIDALGKVTTFEYPTGNNKGLPDSVKDARDNITKFIWNTAGLLQEVEDPYQKKTIYSYDARGRIKTLTNALQHMTQWNYFDDSQRKVEMIYPNSDKVTYKYDNRRLLESVIDERGKITSYDFDDTYRLKKIIDPLQHIVKELNYDSMSNIKWGKDALGNQTDYKYDDFNRLKEIEYPPSAAGIVRLKESFKYDKVGRIKEITDTAGRLTAYNYDDTNRINTVTNTDTEITTTKYNQRFQTIEIKDDDQQIYQFTYDPFDRLLTQTRAGATMTYEYDEAGNRKKRIDYAGRITHYTYDKLNRLEKILYGDAVSQNEPPNLQATYTYDELSRLKTATNEAGTVSFNYDNRNRVKNTTDVFGHLIEYEYEYDNANLNQTRLKFDGAMYAKHNFDDANRLSNILNSSDNTTISFTYDAENKLQTRTYPNGITTTYDYDDMDRLKRLKDSSSSATLFDRQYQYNSASRIETLTELTQTKTFSYNNAYRLMGVSNAGGANESYLYDDVGNRTSSHRSASYGYPLSQSFNRLISTASANYNYDANGNMTTKAEGSNFWHFRWDYENRLTSASTRRQTVRYRYDALGRRVQRYIVGGRENTKFIYDGHDVLIDDNAGILTKYINGAGIDKKLRVQTGSDVKYLLADQLGSTNGLTDDSGNLTSQTSYDSFGNATNQSFPTRYQFTGREFDSFTGLHYYRARQYDANLGRFISEDPIGFAGGDINLYGYVRNNPVSFRDPSGKIVPFIVGAIVVGGLILTSPSYANAPDIGDPIYDSRSDIVANAAMGAAGGYVLRIVCGRIFGAIGARFLSGGGGVVTEEVAETVGKTVAKFSPDDFAYGPSAGGKLAEWAENNGIKTLTNLAKPTELTIEEFSAQTIEKTALLGNKVHFDLTYVKNLSGILKGTGEFSDSVTAFELQYIQANWGHLSNSVVFYKNGQIVPAPW